MKHSDPISSIQFASIVTGTMVGISLLGLPRFVVQEVGNAAPIESLFGILCSLVGVVVVTMLGKKFPKQTIISYNKIVLGKFLGNFFNIILIVFFLLLMGLETRQFAEVMVGALLPSTPIQVSIFLIIFLCSVISFQNVSSFAFIHFFYLPLSIIPLFLVLIPSFRDIEIYHLLPIFGHNVSINDFLNGSLRIGQAISNFLVIAMIIPYMKNPNKSVKSGVWGFLLGGLIVFSLITITLGVFGEVTILEMFWPALVLGRMVQVPGEVLARIDAILIISWIFAVFTSLLSYFFFSVRGIAEMLNTEKHRVIKIIGFLAVFCIALIPQNIYEMYDYILKITTVGVLLIIPYPLLILMIAKLRKKKGDTI
ncbi:GerAB/ArcD/ProY family transporter [Lysinibacillus telephonicus]|uniref:GerAB/ArcD/ProY family transporter n=1 Tax=Lysinibacillus telephonicus TaxID=1714840 RepID=UPI003BA1EBDF